MFFFCIMNCIMKLKATWSLFTLVVLCHLSGSSNASGSTFIIGGEDAKQGEIPYLVNLRYLSFRISYCSGALLEVNGKQLVITLASCCHEAMDMDAGRFDGNKYTGIMGDLLMSDTSEHEQQVKFNRAIFHPDFEWNFNSQHLCILGLNETRYNYTEDVRPIALPPRGMNTTGELVIAGWGGLSTDYLVKYPDNLQKAVLQVVSHDECVKAYENDANVDVQPYMICASAPSDAESDRGVCTGDRGGPVLALEGNYLAGIATPQPSCPNRDLSLPDLYIDVAKFVDWIEQTAEDL